MVSTSHRRSGVCGGLSVRVLARKKRKMDLFTIMELYMLVARTREVSGFIWGEWPLVPAAGQVCGTELKCSGKNKCFVDYGLNCLL